MIRCTNCGTMNPDNRTNCLNCMAVLPVPTARSEQGPSPRTNILQDQPVLPAWLESLRAGDHPAAPPKNFSQDDMVEEGKVPSWMQSDRPTDQGSNPYPAMRSASSPAPNTDETFMQGRNISANSLIDENALPSWMQQPEKQQSQPQNISASSLIQPEYMPEWMKTAQAQGQPSSPLPQQQRPQTPVQGFSAQQLIDPQSLPNWMQPESGQNVAPPAQQPPMQSYSDSQNQRGFSASSLLDMNSMPSWMSEGQQQNPPAQPQSQSTAWQTQQQSPMQQRGYEQPWQPPQQGSSSQSWQMPSQPQSQGYPPASPMGNNAAPTQQGQGGTLSMGSLIDMNSLPSWLRSAAESQQQGQPGEQQGYAGSNSYGTPPRVDNVRVPSRPRGEAGTNEGSEVAANVFASMLGVASNAPQFPQQQQPSAFNSQSSMMPPQQMPEVQRNSTNSLNSQNYGQQMGYPGSGQGMYGSTPNSMLSSGMSQQQPTQNTSEKTAKKGGLFEAIRNFFFRQ